MKSTMARCLSTLLVSAAAAAALVSPSSGSAGTVYFANYNAFNISAFAIFLDGALDAPSTPFPVGDESQPGDVVISADGRMLYAPIFNKKSVAAFEIDQSSGGLTELDGSPVALAGFAEPNIAAVAPDGRFLFLGGGTLGEIFSLPLGASGLPEAPSEPSAVLEGLTGLAVSPDGEFLVITAFDDDLSSSSAVTYRVDRSSGGLEEVSNESLGAAKGPSGVVFAPNGRWAYVGDILADEITAFELDSESGALTSIGAVSTGAGPWALAVTPDGRHLYSVNFNDGSVSTFEVLKSGALEPVAGGDVRAGRSPRAIAITPDGGHLYVGDFSPVAGKEDIAAFRRDRTTGALKPDAVYASNEPREFDVDQITGAAVTPDRAPRAAFTVEAAPAGSETLLDASASSGGPDLYRWSFGDGTEVDSEQPVVRHVYARAGDYQVSLSVEDEYGCGLASVSDGQAIYCGGSTDAITERQLSIAPPVTDVNDVAFEPPIDHSISSTSNAPSESPGELTLTLSGSKTQRLGRDRGVKLKLRCRGGDCSVRISGRIVVPKVKRRSRDIARVVARGARRRRAKVSFKTRKVNLRDGQTTKVVLRVSKGRAQLKRLLRRSRKRSVRVTARASSGDRYDKARKTIRLR